MKRLPGIKSGAPFEVYVEYSVDGTPEVFPASELRAQVRDRAGRLLSELVATSDPGAPSRTWLSAAVTAHWPAGEVYFDVYRANCATPYTETVTVPVERAQTRLAVGAPSSITTEVLAMPASATAAAPLGSKGDAGVARVVIGAPGIQRTIVIAQVQATVRGAQPRQVVATEAMFAGAWVHVHSANGAPRVRLANALAGLRANGFIKDACAAGVSVLVHCVGEENTAVGAVAPGDRWLSTQPGKCAAAAPARQADSRVVAQRVGVAMTASSVHFAPGDVIYLAPATNNS